MCKYYLSYSSLYRTNYNGRITNITTKRDEFARFFDAYGAASAHFSNHNDNIEFRSLAEAEYNVVGMTIQRNQFFVPSLVPDNVPDRIEEFFSILAGALISYRNKLLVEIPEWVNVFRFPDEILLLERKAALCEDLRLVEEKILATQRIKNVLFLDGDRLVEEVANALSSGLGLLTSVDEKYREDLTIVGEDGKPLMFVEIKGTNRGVKREHINQADSHRERAGLAPDFPTVLIVNTHIRNARCGDEKDIEIATEQVQHAERNRVLIVRTLDLVRLVAIAKSGRISVDDILELLITKVGWLRVDSDKWEVVQGGSG